VSKNHFPIERFVSAPLVDNYIACFPKRNDILTEEDISKSSYSTYLHGILSELSKQGYLINIGGEYTLTLKGLTWYQNIQEKLLSPSQKTKHIETINNRVAKFSKFGDYFNELGAVI